MDSSIVDVATDVVLISGGTPGVDRTEFSAYSLATHSNFCSPLECLFVPQRLLSLHLLPNPGCSRPLQMLLFRLVSSSSP